MTKKHFEAIARAIRETDHFTESDRIVIASNIAGELAGLCPNFLPGRFIRAATGDE